MSPTLPESDRPPGRATGARDSAFESRLAMIDREIRPGRTVTYLAEVDLSQVESLRDGWTGGGRPSPSAFVVKAVGLALRDFPDANRRVRSRGVWPFGRPRLQEFAHCDVAVAVERDFRGAPPTTTVEVLRKVDEASLSEICQALHALNTRASALSQPRGPTDHRLAPFFRRIRNRPRAWARERGGAALVCAPDRAGVDAVMGSWAHPIGVSFGQIKPRPVAVGTAVEVRPTLFLTLNFDRRVMAGMQAARFLRRMVDLLENAETEMAPFFASRAPDTRIDFPSNDAPGPPPSSSPNHGRPAVHPRR